MTAYATIESAVEAIRAGAYEYIIKSVVQDEFKSLIKKLFRERLTAGGKRCRSIITASAA
jgi:DNA-binding NtrC family response regulator